MSASTPRSAHLLDTEKLNKNVNKNTQNEQPQKMYYAKVSQNLSFPKCDQAIVLQAVSGYAVKDYVSEIIKFTDEENIRFVSRISNGRVSTSHQKKKLQNNEPRNAGLSKSAIQK